jgi:hypothetical protein
VHAEEHSGPGPGVRHLPGRSHARGSYLIAGSRTMRAPTVSAPTSPAYRTRYPVAEGDDLRHTARDQRAAALPYPCRAARPDRQS